MPYGIYSVPWMVLFTSWVPHLMSRTLYPLAYYESLIFSLVWIAVFGCNQTIHRYVCMPVRGYGVLIVRVNLGLLLISGAFCITFEGGMLYL